MGHLKRAKTVLERDQSLIGKQEARQLLAAKKDETDRLQLKEKVTEALRENKRKEFEVRFIVAGHAMAPDGVVTARWLIDCCKCSCGVPVLSCPARCCSVSTS